MVVVCSYVDVPAGPVLDQLAGDVLAAGQLGAALPVAALDAGVGGGRRAVRQPSVGHQASGLTW